MKGAFKKVLPYVCYGLCGIGVVVLFLGLVAVVCDGFLSLTLYANALGFSNKIIYEVLIIGIVIGFVLGILVRYYEVKNRSFTHGELYIDPNGNECEIIKGIRDKNGVPYVIAIDYPETNSATAYTLNFFELMFEKKDG